MLRPIRCVPRRLPTAAPWRAGSPSDRGAPADGAVTWYRTRMEHGAAGVRLLVNVDVADLDAGVDFYTRAFGLAVGRRLGEGVIELTGAQVPLYLLAKAADTRAAATSADRRRYDRHWTPVHLDFVVDDLDAALERALAAGATQETPIRSHTWGRIAHLADPFGHGVCLLEFTALGYDALASPSSG